VTYDFEKSVKVELQNRERRSTNDLVKVTVLPDSTASGAARPWSSGLDPGA